MEHSPTQTLTHSHIPLSLQLFLKKQPLTTIFMQLTEPQINTETAKNLGLTSEEFERIQEILGRVPNYTELSMFAVMWSEHCSYKNSILWLKTLPKHGKRILAEAGEENAGLVDIGDGLACAFKIESHNHPSAIEPYQGAATGVGGIHRDIFTMGARPVATLNSLRFGDIDSNHTKHLVNGVVKGIGDYGNCLGIPTVGGEVYFESCYNQNILVNAMSVGIVKIGETISAVADGPGNPVFIVGSRTGKDGIHGATFASADLTQDSAKDLPSVQVGDPFQEKLLLEATLEVLKSGAIVGMQDMGAAGITCSTAEMCARSKTGMKIYLNRVPTRQEKMNPHEILISESQERMLIVGKLGEEQILYDVFEKWDLECEQIGVVTETGQLEFYFEGEKIADISANSLVLGGGAPIYERAFKKPEYLKKNQRFSTKRLQVPKDLKKVARKIMAAPNIVSRRWIFEQYDSTVGTNAINTLAPSDAAVVRIKGSKKALALTTDCNPSYVYADPYVGAMIAVAEASRNIICSGARPVAITNCLNFGNPYDPEVYWQFVHAVKGMGDACRKFETPVTGGNVSFYNQSVYENHTEPIFPTPTIGMLGILDDLELQMSMDFKGVGDLIYMLGNSYNDVGSSEYLKQWHQVEHSPVPHFDLHEEYEIQQRIVELIHLGMVESVHDVSEGGLFVTLLECAMVRGLGFKVETVETFRKDAFLFGESQSRIVISIQDSREDDLQNFLISHNVSFTKLGEVFGNEAVIDEENFGPIDSWKSIYENTLSEKLES